MSKIYTFIQIVIVNASCKDQRQTVISDLTFVFSLLDQGTSCVVISLVSSVPFFLTYPLRPAHTHTRVHKQKWCVLLLLLTEIKTS